MRPEEEQRTVRIPVASGALDADLILPPDARGVVLFAHPRRGGRRSPAERSIAASLHEARLGTLLIDLFLRQERDEEAAGRRLRYDVELLGDRLCKAGAWLRAQPDTRDLAQCYVGAQAAGAVALVAASLCSEAAAAVISIGGRTDLVAPEHLARIEAPTLLIVGSLDKDGLVANRRAYRLLGGERHLDVVFGASRSFAAPGTLEAAAQLTRDWASVACAPEATRRRYVRGAAEARIEQREDALGTYELGAKSPPFSSRLEAGRRLADALEKYRASRPLVLGVPRGGVEMAAEVAHLLDADLDVIASQKLGVPGQEELALGAVTADGSRVVNTEIQRCASVTDAMLARITFEQAALARRLEAQLRHGLLPLEVAGRVVIVVDDGIATGATLRAIVQSLRHAGARKLVVAAPVGAAAACLALAKEVDELVCLERPEPFLALAEHYRSYEQTSDRAVERVIHAFRARPARRAESARGVASLR